MEMHIRKASSSVDSIPASIHADYGCDEDKFSVPQTLVRAVSGFYSYSTVNAV